ncbi:MAG: protein translocase subunit SecF [Gammaproteobacteria bacterium]|nr:protein translocase subunit SecF [Gammaproteobacteria bacterium]
MEFFKTNTKIDFMGQRRKAAIFSVVICVLSFLILGVKGLNLGLDFTGGTQIEVSYPQAVDIGKIREELTNAGFPEATVQPYGSSHELLIRLGEQKNLDQKQLQSKIQTALVGGNVAQVEYIGPQVGKTLVTNGILAIIVSLLGTLVYVALRFELRFGFSAIVALIHDPIVTLGVFALTGLEFNLITLAAVLTIIGYSINDTIVVYDRVRENFRLMRKGTVLEIINRSINQTLSRTIMTSGLTLMVVTVLFFFGGEVLRGFSAALIVGVIIGTYSSIYVAGSLAVALGLERKHLMPPERTDELGDRP